MQFSPKFIGPLDRPTIIVGEKPGKTRDGSTFSLVGNRTGDFVAEFIGDRTNIILTNIVNELYAGGFNVGRPSFANGIIDLISLIEKHQPKKIICLGAIAKTYVYSIQVIPSDCIIKCFPHPSYINRFFSSTHGDYIQTISNELDK